MIEPLAIINLTPNSFSDGGEVNNRENLNKRLNFLNQASITHCDFGAESTAPMNEGISAEDEIARLKELLLPSLKNNKDNLKLISLDTYHLETINWFLEIQELKDFPLLWNDVSGIVDESVFSLLKKWPNLQYVASHNRVEDRSQTASHMDYVREDDIVEEVLAHFSSIIEKALEQNLTLERFYFDPCFGLAKTRTQNEKLMKEIPFIANKLELRKLLLGISKKSFLRARVEELGGETPYQQAEYWHLLWLQYWQESFKGEILWRLHDPLMALAWRDFNNLRNPTL